MYYHLEIITISLWKDKGYILNKEESANYTANEATTTIEIGDQAISKDVYDNIRAILEE